MSGEFVFTVIVVLVTLLITFNPVRVLRAISWMKANPEFPVPLVRFVRVVSAAICLFNLFKAIVIFLNSN